MLFPSVSKLSSISCLPIVCVFSIDKIFGILLCDVDVVSSATGRTMQGELGAE